MNQISYFGKTKGHRNPRRCVRIHAYAHVCLSFTCACFMHAYAYTGMRAHARVLETLKDKFLHLELGLE